MHQRTAECLLALALAPIFAWMSPFSTDEQSFLTRFGYWCGMIACWLLTRAVIGRMFETAGLLRPMPPFLRDAALALMTAFPMILVVSPATHALTGWKATPYEVMELYFQIAILGVVVSAIAQAALGPQGEVAAPAERWLAFAPASAVPVDTAEGAAILVEPEPTHFPQEEEMATSRLMARLPPNVRGAIMAVQMEDHYARVHTDRGSALVLLRLSDAIAEAAPTQGRQVHRSWWVADEAVEHYGRVGRAGQLRLTNGLTAPVSQRYLKELDELFGPADRVPAATPAPDQET